MIRYVHACDLPAHADLAVAMFRHRAAQFRDRLGWEVSVDALGWETDAGDSLDPIYIVAVNASGGHAGSMRFLPTTGPATIDRVFGQLSHAPRGDPLTWEWSRFCLAPGAGADVACRLLLAASELGLGLGLARAVGVMDRATSGLCRTLGWPPRVMATTDAATVGLWTFSDRVHDGLCARTGITPGLSRRWFDAAFGDLPLPAGY